MRPGDALASWQPLWLQPVSAIFATGADIIWIVGHELA
jgi:hypothetical protein